MYDVIVKKKFAGTAEWWMLSYGRGKWGAGV